MDKDLLFEIILRMEAEGFKIYYIIFDCGNQKLMSKLGFYKGEHCFPNPADPKRMVYMFPDMPHAIKKQVNVVELSGKAKPKQNLHLNGIPIQLRMGEDAYNASIGFTSKGAITLHPRLSVDVYQKTSKSRIRFGLGACALGNLMSRCIKVNHEKVEKAGPTTFDSYLLLCKYTDRFVDVMNGKHEKACSKIDSPNHPHLFELLDYVKFLCKWRNQSQAQGDKYLYFAKLTH